MRVTLLVLGVWNAEP